MAQAVRKIIVCGGGLAGLLTARALSMGLSKDTQITLISSAERQHNIVYGSTTEPTAYEFLRNLDLSEPVLFTKTSTSFSWGTQYRNWPGAPVDWIQCHQQPFPILSGVPLQHHLTRNNRPLSPLMIAAAAAIEGKFAHPPEDRAHPLSRAEYGYQFSANEWARLVREDLIDSRIQSVTAAIKTIQIKRGEVTGIELASGETISGDLYIDCTGMERRLFERLDLEFSVSRTLNVIARNLVAQGLGAPCKTVEATQTGWRSQTHLQNSVLQLRVEDDHEANEDNTVKIGQVREAWVGNCVAVGASAATQDPLTSAPMVMLQRDIERLLELIPVGSDFSVERKEFNRRFENDVAHTGLFASAFYHKRGDPSSFWAKASDSAFSEKLHRKTIQFKSRGVLAKYDLEPFNDEDWTILHHGLGHQAQRFDLQVESANRSAIDQQLNAMARDIEQTVARMPPHHVYVNNMKRYFEKQKYA